MCGPSGFNLVVVLHDWRAGSDTKLLVDAR